MVGMKFMNNQKSGETYGKNYGRIATVVRYDEVAKHVTLMFDDGNGGCDVSTSTLKRWWKKVQDSEKVVAPEVVEPLIDLDNPVTKQEAESLGMVSGDEAVEQAVVDPDSECCGDGTSYSQVIKEILQDEKKARSKKAGKKKEKVVQESWVPECLQFLFDFVASNNDVVFVPATDIKMRTFKTGGHMYSKINYSNKSITVAVQGQAVTDTNPTKVVNHMFNFNYVFKSKFSVDDKQLITQLLTEARNYRIEKNANKTKKEEK